MTQNDSYLTLQIARPLAIITVHNQSRRNALTFAMWQELPALIAEAEADPAVRVLLLRGAGRKSFVSGADISEFETARAPGAPAKAYDRINSIAFAALRRCEKPTMAMIHGHCIGGGFGLAAACDLRFADDKAIFGVPAGRLGLSYPADAFRDIVIAIGQAATLELVYTANLIDAEAALAKGFLNAIVSPDELETHCYDVAQKIAANAPLTLRAAKLAVMATQDKSQRSILASEKAAEACYDSADYEEGVLAFLQKRTPNFGGQSSDITSK